MSLNYLLDGYNIINRSPSLSRTRLEDSRTLLVRLIEENRPQGSSNNSVMVIFDGQPDVYGPPVASLVRVIFSSGESADEKIKDLVSEAKQKKTIVVVTDDKEIKFFVRALGAQVMSVDQFMGLMKPKTTTAPRSKPTQEDTKHIPKTLETRITSELEKIWVEKKVTPTSRAGQNFLQFVGTAGARFVTIQQMRSSGGIWIACQGTQVLIDPGPGSLVQCLHSHPRLDPACLDAIILTHKHIDHSNDINIMVEAMTAGGSKKRGKVFLPADMLGADSIFIDYARRLPEELVLLKEGGNYSIGSVQFQTPVRHIHGVEIYGLLFSLNGKSLALIADTQYFPKIAEYYRAETMIINTVFIESLPNIEHLSLEDAKKIIKSTQPKRAILTHFGKDIIHQNPERFARTLSRECHTEVIAAQDGMNIPL